MDNAMAARESSIVNLLLRVLVTGFVLPVAYCFLYWIPFSFFPFKEGHWAPHTGAMIGAMAIGWFVWRKLKTGQAGPISSVLLGAVLIGGIGFSAGFFGPMILAPEANQGPMLGIFITGPAGVVIGGIAGFIYWSTRARKAQD